jgi:hypothetical protein
MEAESQIAPREESQETEREPVERVPGRMERRPAQKAPATLHRRFATSYGKHASGSRLEGESGRANLHDPAPKVRHRKGSTTARRRTHLVLPQGREPGQGPQEMRPGAGSQLPAGRGSRSTTQVPVACERRTASSTSCTARPSAKVAALAGGS